MKDTKLPKKILAFLENSKAKFEAIEHRTVYTAFDKAATLKVKPGVIAKVLTLKLDKELALAVIGGDKNLDIEKLKKLAKAKKIDFAKEKAIGEAFKGIDPGAIPPFGELWGIKIFCDKKLLESPKIIFSAGIYEGSIKMTPGSFKKSNPAMIVGNFSAARPAKSATTKKKPQKLKPKTRKPAGSTSKAFRSKPKTRN